MLLPAVQVQVLMRLLLTSALVLVLVLLVTRNLKIMRAMMHPVRIHQLSPRQPP